MKTIKSQLVEKVTKTSWDRNAEFQREIASLKNSNRTKTENENIRMSHKNPQKQASSTDCQKQKRKSQMTNRR